MRRYLNNHDRLWQNIRSEIFLKGNMFIRIKLIRI